ncbi:IS3 family transposase [Paraglaciecola aquimarina]|uniref:IS3 family transposase n=1 Tax=Paraglaciecola aquimarina TaxID=1235557 RepID=A0ABU3SZ96_9ALTE|nr:IS3 family transposase [Paraglaciecola aquimarina]MDU0355257.1 IS3 family transposase [Paraglaciecola aquimarina]
MTTRKKYSKEFKLDAISLVLDQQYTRAEAGRSLEVNPNLITRWIKEYEQDNDGQAFRGNGKLTPEQDEIRKLKAKVRQLEMGKKHFKGSDGLFRQGNQVKYRFIAQKKKTYPVGTMCRLLGVKRSGYYRYAKQIIEQTDPTHDDMIDWVKRIAKAAENVYGSRRMKHALNCLGYPVSRQKTRKLMREAGVWVKYRKKYKVIRDSNHNKPLFENILNREFDVSQPDEAYAADITYVWTREGWLYLAVVIDLYSRKVVGWSMSSRMKAKLVVDALRMAIWQRKPKSGLIVHTDRGSQYASHEYRKLLNAHGLIGSMSKKGDCWDNAVVESFFGSLKNERVHWRNYQTRYEAQQDILNYISMFYNSYRLHSYLGYQSPNQYEQEMVKLKKAA